MRPGRRVEVVLVAVLVAGLVALATLRVIRVRGGASPSRSTAGSGAAAPRGSACLQEALADATDAGAEPVGPELDDLIQAVEGVRELEFTADPEPSYLPPDDFSRRVSGFVDEYSDEDAGHDARILAVLGALEPGTDLKALLRRALGEQVVGFYDPDTRQLVVGATDPEQLSFLERVTLAHELEHALADQALGLPLERDDVPEGEEDLQTAATAVVEGDATLTMTLLSLRLAQTDPAALLAEGLAALGGGPTGLPHYVQRSLLFPYEEGLAFVCSLYVRGGWAAVDAAYGDPPASTAEILFPERYGRSDPPTDLPDPADPPGWEPATTQAFGAADLLFLFEAPGGDPGRALSEPVARVASWRAGEVHLWIRGDASAVAVVLEGGQALCGSVRAWQRAASPGGAASDGALTRSRLAGGAVAVACTGSLVRIGIAPDPGTAAALTA